MKFWKKKSEGWHWPQIKKKGSGKTMAALSKLSKSFMLPIALLPIAGLLLGVGMIMANQSGAAQTIGLTLKTIGSVAFDNLAALFCISIAIAYTEDAGVAGLTAFVAWLVFNAFIASFVKDGAAQWDISVTFQLSDHAPGYDPSIPGLKNNLFENYLFSMKYDGYYPPIRDVAPGSPWDQQTGILDSLCRNLNQVFGTTISPDDIVGFKVNSVEKSMTNYDLWFWSGERLGITPRLMTSVLGLIPTLNTGVFAAIFVGLMVAFLYNKFHQIQLPKVIAFFGGVRFVPIVSIVAMIPVACVFIIIWPALGAALNWIGENSGKMPYGLDSFVFGLVKRSLIPFGLHHAFYAPLWWTGAGGSLGDFIDPSMVGNANTINAAGDQSIILAIIGDSKLKLQDVRGAGLHLGRFMSGEYSMMMFALPLASIGMWMGIPKENRKQTVGIYWSVAFTSFLTGITEPLEFTFLFVAPWLYYGIHVPLFALSYMLANIFAVQIGMTFSGGLLDFIIFGIVPTFNGHQTNWWISILIGIAYAPIYFFIFYFVTKKTNIQIPGKVVGAKLYSKDDFRSRNKTTSGNEDMEKLSHQVIEILGGAANIITVDACATRLRINVKNSELVKESEFKTAGAVAAMKKGNYIQAIFGGQSDNIKSKMKELLRKGSE